MSGLRRAVPPTAIVGYSGMLVVPEDVDPDAFAAEIKSKPPVLLIHGDQDELIPVQALFQAAQGLAALDIPVEWHISPGIGHGIDQEGLRHGGEFLAAPIRRPQMRRLAGNAPDRTSQSCHAALLLAGRPRGGGHREVARSLA